jgi:hypothetical protein
MLLKSLSLLVPFILCSCYGYQELPVREQTAIVDQKRDVELQAAKDRLHSNVIDEATAIQLAISFNPNIRIALVRERGWGEVDVQFREAVKPELHIDDDSSTIGLNVDMFSLYKLLSYSERKAWREERAAERSQAEQKGAIIRLTRDVRLAFLDLARLNNQIEILNKKSEFVNNYKKKVAEKIDTVNDVLFKLVDAELNEKIYKLQEDKSRTKLALMRLVGLTDLTSNDMLFNLNNVLAIDKNIMPLDTLKEKTKSAKATNWLLASLEAKYTQKEYSLREAYLRKFGTLSVSPTVTRNSDGVSYGASIHVRIPWPSRSADAIQDAKDERLYAAAQYTAAMHDLEVDIAKQYEVMLYKWHSINNPSISVEDSCKALETELGDNIHAYLDIVSRLFDQQLHQIDEISHYKMSGIILDSLL